MNLAASVTSLSITSPSDGASFSSSNPTATVTGACHAGATINVSYAGQPNKFLGSSGGVNPAAVTCPTTGAYSFAVDFTGNILLNGSRLLSLFQTWNGTSGNTLTSSLSYSNPTSLSQVAYVKSSVPSVSAALGNSMAIDADTAVVGASSYNSSQGEANVYVRQSNGVWSHQQRLLAPSPVAGDTFGRDVAISGNTLVVGAHQQDYDQNEANLLSNAGAAYVYVRSGGVWTLQQKLVGMGSNGRMAGDAFGYAVAISGDTLAVGAYAQDYDADGVAGPTDAGAVYIYTRSGSTWSLQQKVIGFGPSGIVATDNFGSGVSLSGDTLAVGTPLQDFDAAGANSQLGAGAVYVFTRSNGTWSSQQKLVESGPMGRNASDFFGRTVTVDGDTLLVGAQSHSYDIAGGNFLSNGGAAWVFTRSAGTWSLQQKLLPTLREGGDLFGASTSLSGDVTVIGAPYEDSNATSINGSTSDNSAPSAGAAFVFQRSGTTWTQTYYLKAANGENNDNFAIGVAVNGDTVMVGSTAEDSSSAGLPADNSVSNSGAAYIFR